MHKSISLTKRFVSSQSFGFGTSSNLSSLYVPLKQTNRSLNNNFGNAEKKTSLVDSNAISEAKTASKVVVNPLTHEDFFEVRSLVKLEELFK